MRYFAFLSLLGLVFVTTWMCCSSSTQEPAAARGFYYWKTTLNFSDEDWQLADSMGLNKLYLRYFDVDWSDAHQMPVPISEINVPWGGELDPTEQANPAAPYDLNLCPVVYVTNRVFLHDYHPDSLALRISRKVMGITSHLVQNKGRMMGVPDGAFNEMEWEKYDSLIQAYAQNLKHIQIDCDWTPKTREAYFAFLQALKRQNPNWEIHCTIRMHQYRDPQQTGVPPADRGMLMCYNLAPPDDYKTRDAIFDEALFAGYFKDHTYPLSLDVALPLFSWGSLFHEGQFKGLASDLYLDDLQADPNLQALNDNKFRFLQDTVYTGIFVREGDELRLDEASPEELAQAARLLGRQLPGSSLVFFDWNPKKIKQYEVNKLWDSFFSGR